MTSQMYQPDDQMAAENGQTARADEQVVPDDDLATMEGQQTGHDEPAFFASAGAPPADLEPAASAVPADLEPAASAVPDPPGTVPDRLGADEPPVSDGHSGDRLPTPAAVVVARSAAESPHGDDARTATGPWSEIQARFVDDPRASIELAADLVDDRLMALAASVRKRQDSLRSAWQGQDTGTEEMRLALQHYRAFWHRLEEYPAE